MERGEKSLVLWDYGNNNRHEAKGGLSRSEGGEPGGEGRTKGKSTGDRT